MITDDYLSRSRVVQRLKNSLLGGHIHLYVEHLQRAGYSGATGHWFLSVIQDFAFWLRATGSGLGDIEEALVSQYLCERSRHRSPRVGDTRALSRLLSVLREAGIIAPRPLPARDPREDLLEVYRLYLQRQRGLAPTSIASHLWFLRPFLEETRIATSADVGHLCSRDVTLYVERHVSDAPITSSRHHAFRRMVVIVRPANVL